MPKYRVSVREENWGSLEVEAEDEEDARNQVENHMGLNSYRFWSMCRDADGELDISAEEVPA